MLFNDSNQIKLVLIFSKIIAQTLGVLQDVTVKNYESQSLKNRNCKTTSLCFKFETNQSKHRLTFVNNG